MLLSRRAIFVDNRWNCAVHPNSPRWCVRLRATSDESSARHRPTLPVPSVTRVSASKAHGQDLLGSKLPCPDQPHQWDTFRRDSTPWFSLYGVRSQPRLTIVPVNCTPRVLSGGAGAAAPKIVCPHTRCKLGAKRPHKRGRIGERMCDRQADEKMCPLRFSHRPFFCGAVMVDIVNALVTISGASARGRPNTLFSHVCPPGPGELLEGTLDPHCENATGSSTTSVGLLATTSRTRRTSAWNGPSQIGEGIVGRFVEGDP